MRKGQRKSHFGALPLAQLLDFAPRRKLVAFDGILIAFFETLWVERGCKPTDLTDGHPVVECRGVRDVTDSLAQLEGLGALRRIEPEDRAGSR